MRVFFTTLLLTLIFSPALAQENKEMAAIDRGPMVGTVIPSDLSSIDQNGKPRNFDDLVGENGMVLVFVRSADWCPFCKRQLKDISTGADDLTALGYSLVSLSYDNLENIQRYAEENQPNFTMLSDTESEVIDAFQIRNEKYGSKHFANGVPHPMIFVIGNDKIVQKKFAEEGYRNRPPVSLVTAFLDNNAP